MMSSGTATRMPAIRLSQNEAARIHSGISGVPAGVHRAWTNAANADRPPGTRIKKIVADRGSSNQREPPAMW
jgi:hypothetical protein